MGFRIPLCLPLPCLLARQGARLDPREIHEFLLVVSTLLGDRKTTSMFGVVTMQGCAPVISVFLRELPQGLRGLIQRRFIKIR